MLPRLPALPRLTICSSTNNDHSWQHVDTRLQAGDEERMQILEALTLRDADACFVGRGRVDVLAEVRVTPKRRRNNRDGVFIIISKGDSCCCW